MNKEKLVEAIHNMVENAEYNVLRIIYIVLRSMTNK